MYNTDANFLAGIVTNGNVPFLPHRHTDSDIVTTCSYCVRCTPYKYYTNSDLPVDRTSNFFFTASAPLSRRRSTSIMVSISAQSAQSTPLLTPQCLQVRSRSPRRLGSAPLQLEKPSLLFQCSKQGIAMGVSRKHRHRKTKGIYGAKPLCFCGVTR